MIELLEARALLAGPAGYPIYGPPIMSVASSAPEFSTVMVGTPK
jgi:hypothetical protein